ncbi:hypothetical protein [Aequorivita antarctica]|uniref:Uncharacterized protein n=1 Tax=Aequorivita antarctica TaxID=153266 RepID=A0A5C6YUH5_9FLAO|nr:hypothetical protein [Aequorivita antarctica]TXD71219.1 hypothetical protein ESU54_17590 [Aequorivita antarctica]
MTLISCKKERKYDSINFKNLQNDYSLFEVSDELSHDTLNYYAKVYYKKNDFFPGHGLLVVSNKGGDTILKYFGNKRILLNSTIVKEDKRYFIVLANSKNGSYKLTQNDNYSKFFQIDTLNKSLRDVKPLDVDIFNQFYYEKTGKKTLNGLYCKRDSTNSGFRIYSDLIYNDTIYSTTCLLQFIKNDSIGYELFAQPKEFEKQSIKQMEMENTTITRNIPFGKIEDYELVYDCTNCRTSSTDAITIYATKDSIRTELLRYYDFGGNYLQEISLRYFDNHPFIFIHSSHTYGHTLGNLYALDIDNLKTNYVNKIETNYKTPDSLYPRNYYGVDINKKGEFIFGTLYRSDNINGEYSLTGKYNLIKVKRNIYLLEPYDVELSKPE